MTPLSDSPASKGFYQAVKDTFVQLPLLYSAIIQMMVEVLQALPVLSELGEAVLVDILDAVLNISL